MAAQAVPAKIIGSTKTHGIYHVLLDTGKRGLAKIPKPIKIQEDDSDQEDTSEWLKNNLIDKAVEDLQDIAAGQIGRNYNLHCPEKEGCPNRNHEKDQSDSTSQQLLQEQEPPPAPNKPKAPEPLRRSE